MSGAGEAAAGRRLAIVDPSLTDLRGHHVNTALDLTAAAQALGFDVVWLGHAALPRELVPPGVTFFGVFGRTTYQAPAGKRRRKLKHLAGNVLRWLRERRAARLQRRCLRRELAEGVALARLSEADQVLVHTATGPLAEAVRHLYTRADAAALPRLHMRNCYEPETMPGGGGRPYWRALARLCAAPGGERVGFYHETEPGAALDGAQSGAAVGVWPNALPLRLLAALDRHPGRAPGEALVVGFFGDGRAEKGFYRLPDIAEAVRSRPGKASPAWLIQCPPPLDADRRYHDTLERLQRSVASTTVIDRVLPVDDYYGAVLACDVILLPYERERYRTRGSVIILEAIACGKPVVATSGTWLASQIAPGAGIAAEAADLGEALCEVIDAYPQFAAAARARALVVRQQRHPVKVLGRLLGVAPPSREAERLASGRDDAILLGRAQSY